MSRVFQVQTTGRFEVEDFAIHIPRAGKTADEQRCSGSCIAKAPVSRGAET